MTPCHNGSDVTISHWPPSRADVLLLRLPTRLNMDETPKIGMSTGEFEGNVSPALVGAKMTSLVTYLEVPLRIHLEYSFSRGVYPFGTEILDQAYADGVMRLALVSHVANVYMHMWQSVTSPRRYCQDAGRRNATNTIETRFDQDMFGEMQRQNSIFW